MQPAALIGREAELGEGSGLGGLGSAIGIALLLVTIQASCS
jgi:hypothetical protein